MEYRSHRRSSAERPSRQFPLTVLTEFKLPTDAPWDTGHWDVAGVVAGNVRTPQEADSGPVKPAAITRCQVWTRLHLKLFQDEADSYYHNIMGAHPCVFVLCRRDHDNRLRPEITTLSYEEAMAYSEVEEEVFSVPVPAEIYRWVENFILENYVPEKRKKRKRDDWNKESNSVPARPRRQ